MELQGRIIKVCELRKGVARTSGNPWASQDYVLETHDQFPRRMMFNVYGEDKINSFNIQEGEELNVSFDINAREYNGRWYNDIRAWRVERVQPGQAAPAAASAPQPFAQPAAPQPFAQPAAVPPTPTQPAAVPPASAGDPESDLPF